MNRRKLGPPPDWIRTKNPGETEPKEPTDPLQGIFNASRTARLGEQEDDALVTAFRERRDSISDAQVLAEIKALFVAERKRSQPFADLHISPTGTTDVSDVRSTRLVILSPHHVHSAEGSNNAGASAASTKAQAFLANYGVGRRRYRNSLIFLAPDAMKMQEFMEDMRAMLAWQNLIDSPGGRLDARYADRARTHFQRYQERRDTGLREAFCWLLVPTQSQPDSPLEWRELRLPADGGILAERAAGLLTENGLLRSDEGLADELGRVRAWLGDQINNPILLAEEFARHLYLPRITDERLLYNVLKTVLAAGIPPRTDAKRPFTTSLRLDANALASTGVIESELLTALFTLVNPADLKLTLQIEALVSDPQRRQLERAVADQRTDARPIPRPNSSG